jgi:hypothetical protein
VKRFLDNFVWHFEVSKKNKKHHMKTSKERTKWGSVTTYTKINKGLGDKTNRRGVSCHDPTLMVVTMGLQEQAGPD